MKLIKENIEYLYNKYYYFQNRVGNSDIAKYTPLMIITGVINLYLLFFFIMINILFGVEFPKISKATFFIIFFIILLLLYMSLVYNGKYKKILLNDKIKKRNNILAILFPLIGFILFNIGWILKMLQNQGKL